MPISVLPWHSLKTRITLTTLLIFLVSLWALSFYASRMLQEDMRRLLGEQQSATVAYAASELQGKLDDRIKALEMISKAIDVSLVDNPVALQKFLDQRFVLHSLFNDGIRVYQIDGTSIVASPLAPERVGGNYLDRDYVLGPIKYGKSTIGQPVMGRAAKAPVVIMAVPIRDMQGRVIGALSGITNLAKPNFMDNITDSRYGKTGGFFIVAPQYRIIVTATDKTRIMETHPPPGVNSLLDRRTQGYEGSETFVNPKGDAVLSSAKGVPLAGWYVSVALPVAEAFAPIYEMKQRMWLATLFLTLLAGGVSWWLLSRQFSPLVQTARTLAELSGKNEHPHSLPIQRQDEIGQLVSGFNRLLETLGQREQLVRASEARYRTIFETSQDVITINRLSDGLYIDVNPAFLDISGYSRNEAIGHTTSELNVWADPDERLRYVDFLKRDSKCLNFEAEFRRKDGKLVWGQVTASVIELDDVTCVISIRRDITERKRTEEKINYLAYFDQLTDLPNRTLLYDRLKQAMANSQRSGNHGALLLLDLDHFKTLNDTLGHHMGDLLLKQVAQRLTECVREEDTVARLGGDEFIVMLVNLSESQRDTASLIELIGGKINAALNQPYELKDVSYRITPSIGASVFLGQQTEIETLLKQADLAMYKAKNAGRNTLRFFDPDMARDVLKRATLEKDLREAVQKKQFALHYQAQIAGSQVTGVETLLRWQHPERGLVYPNEFISVIEETGLILPVGQWVLETACQQLANWATQPDMSHLTVAVNISAHQLNHEDFVGQVLMAIELSGANPQRLKLELTESLLVNNVDAIIGKMVALKTKGVGFSLDDFGTGYSSLSYLKRLPLDQLKIDQSFVKDILTDPNDAAIARMIVVLAENLGLTVIAEGVETEAQKDSLCQHGCHAYQGYLFSYPLPLNEFESYIKRVYREVNDCLVLQT